MELVSIVTGSRATEYTGLSHLGWFFWLLVGIWLFGFVMHWIAGRAIARDLAKKPLSERLKDKDMPLHKILGVKPPPKLKDPIDYMKGMK